MQRSAAAISDSLKKVPPFPPVAVKLLSLLSNPAVDTNEVADLIGSDATFTARLLQRVNSAEFGFISDITNVRRAVALLGLDTTRQITLAHAAAAYAQGGLKTETMRRCWQHTVATAVLAEEIAVACDTFASVAFTAGIMHDIGRLGLLVAYPEEYERVIRNAAARSLDVLDFEAGRIRSASRRSRPHAGRGLGIAAGDGPHCGPPSRSLRGYGIGLAANRPCGLSPGRCLRL